MTAHFADLVRKQSSPGLIIVKQNLSFAGAIDDLLLIWVASDASELQNRIRWIPISSTAPVR